MILLAVALVGCTYRVTVDSDPPGALMTLRDGRTVVLPEEVRFHAVPFTRRVVTVTAPGYRTAEVDTSAYLGRPREVEVLLVREHGPAGTWTAEQIRDGAEGPPESIRESGRRPR